MIFFQGKNNKKKLSKNHAGMKYLNGTYGK